MGEERTECNGYIDGRIILNKNQESLNDLSVEFCAVLC